MEQKIELVIVLEAEKWADGGTPETTTFQSPRCVPFQAISSGCLGVVADWYMRKWNRTWLQGKGGPWKSVVNNGLHVFVF